MKLEVLISAMNAEPEKLIDKMHVTTDAVLINQCSKFDTSEFKVANGIVRVFSFDERGVGQSRNRAIEQAKDDILLFSDDDIEYTDNYEKIILSEFIEHPEADALFFNVEVCKERRTYWNTDYKRVRIWNGGRYPAYSIAVRKSSLDKAKVRYSLLFGGGAKYSCGEDSIFIKDCLKAKIKMYRTTAVIGREVPRVGGESSWFKGYDEKFFFDRGVLYKELYGRFASLFGFRFVYTKKSEMCKQIPWRKALKILNEGIKEKI